MNNAEHAGVVELRPGKDNEKTIEQAPRAVRSDLLCMVIHELRTPLTAVNAVLKMADVGTFGEMSNEAKKQLEMANNNVARMIRLVNDLLDLERFDAGRMRLTYADVSAVAVIDEAVRSVEPLARQKNVGIKVNAEDTFIFANADRITQVLINLLSNAIKFSPAGSTVEVTIARDADTVKFSVSDRGRGIPIEKQRQMFERFQQVCDNDASSGTGLGLYVCKHIIDAHGGTIGVHSEQDRGATFWFSVPAGRSAEREASTPAVPFVPSPRASQSAFIE